MPSLPLVDSDLTRYFSLQNRLFFYREHSKMPDNRGERREALVILEKVEWKDGLMNALMTDAEVSRTLVDVIRIDSYLIFLCLFQTGIIGDVKDIQRR